MHIVKKVLLGLLIVVVLLAIIIAGLRLYYSHRYEQSPQNGPAYLMHPHDISAYPTSIEGATVTPIDHGACQGFHLVPQVKTHQGVVVCFGGSEGSPNFQLAAQLASQGYETCALFMFGAKNQPATLLKIPLEQFSDVLAYLDSQGLSGEPLTVFGASKGAEYALNLADKYPQINAVVLMAPSAYTFMGLDFSQLGSSWTYSGQELDYINVQNSSFPAFIGNVVLPALVKAPISYGKSYESAIQYDPAANTKRIPLNHSNAQVLLFAGTDDAMWPSASMAKQIAQEIPDRSELHIYEGAGHMFWGDGVALLGNTPIATGGTAEANEEARVDYERVLAEFLARQHPSR